MRPAKVLARSFLISAALLCGTVAVRGDNTDDTYYDLVRPHGQPRGNAAFNADLKACYKQTGANRFRQDNDAMKQCMLGRKWQWQSVRIVHTPSGIYEGGAPDWTYNGCVFNPADC